MITPKVWGQGALFVYSGLEGNTNFKAQLIGSLLGDHVGIHFCTKEPFDLFVDTTNARSIRWNAVTSDLISGTIEVNGVRYDVSFAMASNATVVGKCPPNLIRLVFMNGKGDGVTKLTQKVQKNHTYFCLSREEKSNCDCDMVDALIDHYFDFFKKLDCPVENFKLYGNRGVNSDDIAETFSKAMSILKGNVYSAEKPFKQLWTTPDRWPHRMLWLWDSCFHSFSNWFISEKLSMDSLKSLFDAQNEDGFIPICCSPDFYYDGITQPPLIAWALEKYVKRTGNLSFAADYYDKVSKYLEWDIANRCTENGLFFWHVEHDSVHCRCGECGMDNSPRFDNVEEMECIDFSSYMVREGQAMESLAVMLGKEAEAEHWGDFAQKTAKAINDRLWDEEDGMYYDLEIRTQRLHKCKTIASYLTLFAGVCTGNRLTRMLSALNDEQKFKSPFVRAGVSMDEPGFSTDMFRGPVWMNILYMVVEGLYRMNDTEDANEIVLDAVSEMTYWYKMEGVLYEYYDCMGRLSPHLLDRKGKTATPYIYGNISQTIRDYGWTAAVFASFILEHNDLFNLLPDDY